MVTAPVLPQGGSLPPWHLGYPLGAIFECYLVLINYDKEMDRPNSHKQV